MKLDISITAIPKRLHWVKNMLRVVPEATVFVDHDMKGLWWNTQRAWKPRGGTHVLVMQDDLLLCPSFRKHLQIILELRPQHLVSFYQSMLMETAFQEAKGHWITCKTIRTAQAILMPAEMTEWVSWANKIFPNNPADTHDDERIMAWQDTNHIPVWITCPELVAHIGHTQSSIGYVRKETTHPYFLKEDKEIDWTQGLLDPQKAYCAPLRWRRTEYRKVYPK